VPARKDHAAELRENIIAALVDLPVVTALHDRRLLINLIRLDAPDFPDVLENSGKRLHLVELVVTCFRNPTWLRALGNALRTMDPEGATSRHVRSLIESGVLAALLPETALKEARAILARLPHPETIEWQSIFSSLDSARSARALNRMRPIDAFEVLCYKPTFPLPPALVFLDELSRRVDASVAADLSEWVARHSHLLGVQDELAGARVPSENSGLVIDTDITSDSLSPESTRTTANATDTDARESAVSVTFDSNANNTYIGVDMPPVDAAQQTRERLPLVWGNVPPRNPNFTGREAALEYLHTKLQNEREAAVLPKALHGMGGVGKSQIAIEYVHRYRSDYDLIWWVQAERTADILVSLTELAYQLKLDLSRQANYAVPVLLDALNTGQIPHENWLLVFDNAEDVKEVRAYFPTGGDGTILVTSRNLEWQRAADEVIEVDVFTPEESREFLLNRSPDLNPADADQLGEALGYLPLAVEQAASWHAVTGMPVNEYLQLLAAKRIELLSQTPSHDDENSVAAAWNVSLDRLQQINPAALQMLQVCSFFAPSDISRDLFVSAPVAITPELDKLLGDSIQLARAIRDIQRFALARFNIPTSTFQIHRLVQAVLVSRLSGDQPAIMRFGAHALLANADPKQPDKAELWPRFQMLHRHFEASGVAESAEQLIRPLTLHLVEFLYRWGAHTECRDVARKAHDTWSAIIGAEHPQTLELASWLGYILWVLGEFTDAAHINRRTFETYERVVGIDDEGALNASRMVCADQRAAGAFREAKARAEDVFQRARNQFGPDDPVTLLAAHDLSVCLRLTGEYAKALELDADTIRRRTEVLGYYHPETLRTLCGLAIDRREAGEFVPAQVFHEQIYQRFLDYGLGPDTPQMMLVARTLAVARRKAGDHSGAKEIAEVTLEKFRRRYGEEYPDTLATTLNYAIDLRHAGHLEQAKELGVTLLDRYRRILGDRHPHTMSAQTNLAIVYRLLGDPEEAHRLNKTAHEALVGRLGEDHPVALTCAANLASDLHATGEFQAAYELDIDTLERSQAALGKEHPSVLACSANLALDLRALGRAGEAEKIHGNTMSLFRKTLGDKHPATLNALQSIRADCDVDPMPI
jgi:hypothetical protein